MLASEKVTTSEAVNQDGIYHCLTCEDAETILFKEEIAPMCDNCKRPVSWELRRPPSKHA